MRVLLPPSESKRPDGGSAISRPLVLTHDDTLRDTRARVQEALVEASSLPDAATRVFKLGVKAAAEVEHNMRLDTAPVLPSIERYVGVVFDEIDVDTLPVDAREWINTHVLIQSALFGIVSAGDLIPPYRLSASTRLTDQLGATLKRVWNDAFKHVGQPNSFTLDLRSKDYQALAPLPSDADWISLDIVQRTEDGGVRALNHFNKRAKGDLVRRLALSDAHITSTDDFNAWAASNGLEVTADNTSHSATLVTELGVSAAR